VEYFTSHLLSWQREDANVVKEYHFLNSLSEAEERFMIIPSVARSEVFTEFEVNETLSDS
jgi:hypothetical protein